MLIPLVYLVLLFLSFFLPESDFLGCSYKFFMSGLRDRVRSTVNVEATRNWLKILSKEEHGYAEFSEVRIPSQKWSKLLKKLKPDIVSLLADENSNPKLRLRWGSGAMGHWGVVIGMKDMIVPSSDYSQYGEYRLSVEQGIYVWWAFE
jgi:hypothetical protein